MTNYTYAIGDIHGRYDLLQDLTTKINQHTANVGAEKVTLVFLGDYVDRGPMSAHTIEYLRGLTDTDKLRHIILKGNHEDMMVNVYDYWIPNGGDATIESYQNYYGEWWEEWLAKDAEWMSTLPMVYTDFKRVYVHAALDHTKKVDEQNTDVLMWAVYRKDDTQDFHGMHVVHGHVTHKKPLLLTNRTCVDTGAWMKGGALTAAVFKDNQPGGPVAILQAGGN